MSRYLVLAVRGYNFQDEKDTSRTVEGVTVHYLDPDALDETDPARAGFFPLQCPAPLGLLSSFLSTPVTITMPQTVSAGTPGAGSSSPGPASSPSVPGVYELRFAQRPGKGNRPVLTCVAAEFVAPVDITKITQSARVKP